MAIGPLRTEHLGHDAGRVQRRVYVNAPPSRVWLTLHDPLAAPEIFPELSLGPAEPTWPAAAAVRPARARLGLLRTAATVESLEARPARRFRLRVAGRWFESEWCWQFDPIAGGTRVVHDAVFEPGDRLAGWLVRLGRDSVADRVETHLRLLKMRAERDWLAVLATHQSSGGSSEPVG
ncbi:MAG TPA: SRPBCC family protein [Candidatus Saccharimonadales bacterium]|nr:SRPBCC family protein [Candidatus Saccharimonadales bacterium]